MLRGTVGLGMILLFAAMGCEGTSIETEELWVGVIDPSEEGGEALDDEVLLGETAETDMEEASELSGKATLPPEGDEASKGAVDADEETSEQPVNEPAENPSSGATEEEAQDEIVIESDVDESAEEVSQGTEETHVDNTTESTSQPTSGYVLFSVDMACSNLPSGEPVYVLGMDKWNENWSIAVELKEDEIPGHYSGLWEGDAGHYSFLLSYGGYEHDEWSPWYGVESIEGQACVGDDYDNRAVVVEPGLATNLALTHGYCNGCPGSCSGLCGGQSDDGGCFCDSLCEEYDDCCADFAQVCEVVTCEGHCGGKPEQGNCYCDSLCSSYNDCCDDFVSVCEE